MKQRQRVESHASADSVHMANVIASSLDWPKNDTAGDGRQG